MCRVTFKDDLAVAGAGVHAINARGVARRNEKVPIWRYHKGPDVGSIWLEDGRDASVWIHAVDATFWGRCGKDGAVLA